MFAADLPQCSRWQGVGTWWAVWDSNRFYFLDTLARTALLKSVPTTVEASGLPVRQAQRRKVR